MNTLLGQELAAARMSDIRRQTERSAMVRQARGGGKRSAKRSPASYGRFVPSGALRLGRAIGLLRTKSVNTQIIPC